MKTLLTILLVGAILALPLQAQTNAPSAPQPKGALLVVVLLAVTAVAAGVVIYVYTTSDTYAGNHTLVLYRASWDEYTDTQGAWTPIKTNTIYVRTKKTELFREETRTPGYVYRVEVLPVQPQ